MENIWVETTQQVHFEQKIASVGERLLAQLIDFIFQGAYLLMVFGILAALGLMNTGTGILFSLPVVFYSLASEIFMNGQSLGKRFLHLRVVKKDGSSTAFFDFFVRWIFRLVDILLFFGGIATLTIILNGKGQRLGDLAAGTMVIRNRNNLKSADNLQQVAIPENYQPVFHGVDIFKEKDIKTLLEILVFFKSDPSEPKAVDMMRKAAEMVEKKLGIQSGMNPADLLTSLIRDYYAQFRKEGSANKS